MRVISGDHTINASYDGNIFCVVENEDDNKYYVSLRSLTQNGWMPMAAYDTKEKAIAVMDEMRKFAIQTYDINDCFYLEDDVTTN